jgi:hypothetical protein
MPIGQKCHVQTGKPAYIPTLEDYLEYVSIHFTLAKI